MKCQDNENTEDEINDSRGDFYENMYGAELSKEDISELNVDIDSGRETF